VLPGDFEWVFDDPLLLVSSDEDEEDDDSLAELAICF
jgi:hypothetical protein